MPSHDSAQKRSSASGPVTPNFSSKQKGRSKILNMPMPPGVNINEEDMVDGRKGGKNAIKEVKRKKPKVIGKLPPTKMSEDGSDWGKIWVYRNDNKTF